MSKSSIYLRNKVLENELMTSYDVAAYTALRKYYNWGMEEELVTTDVLLYQLYGKNFDKVKRATKENFIEAINHLNEIGVINITDTYDKDKYIIDMDSIFFTTSVRDPAVAIEKYEISDIFNIDCNENKTKILRYFITIIGSIDYKTKVGFMPIDYLSKKADISMQTAIAYNKLLEDNKIIYIKHGRGKYTEDGIKTELNSYVRYEDRRLII